MSLLALRVALQGLFPLTPIAAAVQGLIEQIQEEQRNPIGGGGRKRPARPFDDATDEDIARLVRDKWAAIEARRAQETPVPSTRPEPSVQKTPEIAHEVVLAMPLAKQALPDVPPLTAAVDPEATEARRLRQQRNDEHALVLMLAEMI